MKIDRMNAGVWLYGLANVGTGILNIVWRGFEFSHQPIKAIGHVPGEPALAIIAGIWLIAAGISVLWQRTARMGAAASALIYVIFALFWIFRYTAMTHTLGFRMGILIFCIGGAAAQLLLAAPASIIYVATGTPGPGARGRALRITRWALGLPLIAFALEHLLNLQAYVRFVPRWVPLSTFWVVLTGIAFLLAGCAIIAGIKDVFAARMLALMLFLFELMVEIAPVFAHPGSQGAWGGAIYNLTAIGACWIFAEFTAGCLMIRGKATVGEDVALAGGCASA